MGELNGAGERAGFDAARRQLGRRAAMVGLLMRGVVNAVVAIVALADPDSAARAPGRWLLGVVAVWSLYRIASRSVRVGPAVVDYGLVIGVCLAIPFLVPDNDFHLSNNAPLAIAGTAVIGFSVAVRPRVSLPLALGIAISYACGSAAVLGWGQVSSVAALYYFALQWCTAALIRYMVLRIAAAVDQARAARQSAETDREVGAAVRSFEREQLALLHDTAASTLMMAGQGAAIPPERLADQARRDLGLLSDGGWNAPPPRAEIVRALRECATHLQTPVEFDGVDELWVEGLSAEPVIAAAREVMNNVDRHSRASLLRITVTSTAVRLSDDGVGFDPDAPRLGHGVTDSILGRMQRAGGRATVRSAPGAGTDVELSWAAWPTQSSAGHASDPDSLIERVRVRYGLALMAYALLNLAFAVPYAGVDGTSGWFGILLVIVAAVATLAAVPRIVCRSRTLGARWAAAAALLAVAVLQPMVIAPNLVGGHAHWAQNAIGWCLIPMLLDLPVRRGVAIVTGYWVVGAVVVLICQPSAAALVNIGLGTASILSVQIFALVFNGLVQQAAREVQSETQASRRVIARLRIQQAVRAEYQRRYADLVDNVLPLLRELSTGAPVTRDLQRRARAESRRLRVLFDQATAFGHPLMQHLRTLVDEAEARGVEVQVDLAGDLPDLADEQIEEFAVPLQRAAEAAQTFLRLVVSGAPEAVSVSIVCDPGPDRHALVRQLSESPTGPEVVQAGHTLWIEVRCATGTLADDRC
ncbi:ATP-binding protein [Mycobacterium sp. ACS4331]|uniref:sensor histidine kinase n=1 Tax=Mycobacterium sp. ACS4331 TaxID=1834121 RepID=UPI0007FEFA45|nr:ATP-binding protein [Mycobacterium sp. ACS4331]OBF29140.1 histidine kinase [Mycobacterium sp. ACS4331]